MLSDYGTFGGIVDGEVLMIILWSNVSKILQQKTTHQSSQSNNYNVSNDDTTTTEEETRIKGEMTMLVYATLSYLSVYHALLRFNKKNIINNNINIT